MYFKQMLIQNKVIKVANKIIPVPNTASFITIAESVTEA